ncbi:MAG: hypothetical protein AB1716_03165 [Planctomycetota bacterium]
MLRFVLIGLIAAALLSIGLRLSAPGLVDELSGGQGVVVGAVVWAAALALAGVDRVARSGQKTR